MIPKPKTQIHLMLVFILAFQNMASACSCWPYEPAFCRIVTDGFHIVRGVVTNHPQSSLMEVQLLENLNKEIAEDTIVVLGQDGLNCGELLYQFHISDTLILAVQGIEINNDVFWYLEGACGLHFLRYENGIVSGQITDSLTSQPIQGFRDNLFACLELQVPVEETAISEGELLIYPNPVLDNFQLSVTQTYIAGYEIYNSAGCLISSCTFDQYVQKHEIDSKELSKGVYYIRIRTPAGMATRKFIRG